VVLRNRDEEKRRFRHSPQSSKLSIVMSPKAPPSRAQKATPSVNPLITQSRSHQSKTTGEEKDYKLLGEEYLRKYGGYRSLPEPEPIPSSDKGRRHAVHGSDGTGKRKKLAVQEGAVRKNEVKAPLKGAAASTTRDGPAARSQRRGP
jgi:hypothetical protein